ncbi:MAG: hypothetical protein ACI8QD_002768 [Cyclobacteriaceae bacterium]|jgi:hypothetical protein
MKSFFILLTAILIAACQTIPAYERDKSIKNDIQILASDSLQGREIGTKGELKAAAYLEQRMKSLGLSPKGSEGYLQKFYVKKSTNPHESAIVSDQSDSAGTTGYNVLGLIDNPGDDIIVIGAHYDHLGFGGASSMDRGSNEIHNGADDNASGTAGLLHLARVLAHQELNSDILFFAISGEEQGLWGSNYYTNHPTVELDKVKYMVNMDMIGRLDTARGLAIYGVGTAPDWDVAIDTTNTTGLKIIKKESGRGPSDHTSFYVKDIPVLHFFTGQHEDYHRPSDDVEKINIKGILEVTGLINRIIQEVEDQGPLDFQTTKDESTNAPRFTVSLGVMPDYLYEGLGMMIADVSEDKPAKEAGIEKGDVVIQMGDSTITDMMSYMRALSGYSKGDQTEVVVERSGKKKAFTITF